MTRARVALAPSVETHAHEERPGERCDHDCLGRVAHHPERRYDGGQGGVRDEMAAQRDRHRAGSDDQQEAAPRPAPSHTCPTDADRRGQAEIGRTQEGVPELEELRGRLGSCAQRQVREGQREKELRERDGMQRPDAPRLLPEGRPRSREGELQRGVSTARRRARGPRGTRARSGARRRGRRRSRAAAVSSRRSRSASDTTPVIVQRSGDPARSCTAMRAPHTITSRARRARTHGPPRSSIHGSQAEPAR